MKITAAAVLFLLMIPVGPVLAGGTRGEVQLDLAISPGGLTQSIDVEIAASGGRFFAVWCEMADSDDVFYCFSDDGGETWSSPPLWIDMDSTSNDSEPYVVADGDLVCIAWLHKPEIGGPEDVSAVVSTDGGLTFGPRINISGTMQGDKGDADIMSAAVADPCIYVLFEDDVFDPGGAEDLFVASSRDRGQTFDEPIRLNDPLPGTIDVDEPRIAAAGADAYAVWKDSRAVDDRLFLVSTADGGATWSSTNRLVTYLPSGADVDGACAIAVSGDHVYVAWQDNRSGPPSNGNNQVFLARSTDRGATWDPDQQVGGTPVGAWALEVDVAAAGPNVHVAFRDTRSGPAYDVHVASSSDWGKTFPDVETLDADLGTVNSTSPRLAAADGTVFCSYLDQNETLGRDVLWVGYSTAQGKTGTWTREQLSRGPVGAYDVDSNRIAAAGGGRAVAAWEDDRASHPFDTANDVYANQCVPAEPSLTANPAFISASSGGTVNFTLTAGAENARRNYVILGSRTGTHPGIPLPGGLAVLPLIRDGFTVYVAVRLNTPFFMNFRGVLNTEGNGAAQLNTGPVPALAGSTMYFAYALNTPWDFASNPVAIDVAP